MAKQNNNDRIREIKNRKARHEYFFVQTYEAGIVLKGTEIKSIRQGKVSFKDSYARIDKQGEVWLLNLHISPYEKSTYFNHEATRPRKLLLNKREIKKMNSKIVEGGMTLIPASIYINEKSLCKVELAIAKGKKNYDKREVLQKKDQQRDAERSKKMHF
jgi:SsrA-binding protein